MKRRTLAPGFRQTTTAALVLSTIVLFGGSCAGPAPRQSEDQPMRDIAELYRLYQLSFNPWSVAGVSVSIFRHAETDTVGAAISRNGSVLVVFRGTQNRRAGRVDRRHNMMIAFDDIEFGAPGHQVHRGFNRKYSGVRDQLYRYLSAIPSDRVLFAGHSLGGALATLAMYDYAVSGRGLDSVFELVTFGAPRVFNRAAAHAFDATVSSTALRVVNGDDAVPRLPPSLFGYRHIGTELRIGRSSVWKPVSGSDHFPGYRVELEQMLVDTGRQEVIETSPASWEFWDILE